MAHQMSLVCAMRHVGRSLSWSHCPQPLTPLNYTCREPINKPKYGSRQTDATCHWEVQQTQEDGRKQMMSYRKTVWTRKPSVPESYLELVTCKCDNSQCLTLCCKCVQSGQICLLACGCAAINGCLSTFSVADS